MIPWLKHFCPQLDQTGHYLFCVCGTKVNILDVASGALLQSLEQVRTGWSGCEGLEGRAAHSYSALCSHSSLRRTKRTSLPLTSVLMMRYMTGRGGG